jgi:hypothetical protein
MGGSRYVLLISEDGTLVEEVRGALDGLPAVHPMAVVTTVDAVSAKTLDGVKLVVVHVGKGNNPTGPVGRLLWMSSMMRRPIPVLALVDVYKPRQALAFFRMGVADVLSRSHHLDQLGVLMIAPSLQPSPDGPAIDQALARAASRPFLPIASPAS